LNFVHTFINNREKLPAVFEYYFVQNKMYSFLWYEKKMWFTDLHLITL